MSNKTEDVVDSWEEIDEDGLTTKLKCIKNESCTTKIPLESMNGTSSCAIVDEEFKPKIIQRPLTILKRPTKPHNERSSKSNDNKPKAQLKTLDQRQKEYAEARLRILGQAKHPEDDLDDVISTINISNFNGNSIQQSSPSTSTAPSPFNGAGILRMPFGPSESDCGFTMKR